MSKRGLFITFEGADGCGKTTQIQKTAEYLKSRGIDCMITREPGGTELGNKLREILLNYDGEVSNTCELFLYLADRAQHIDTKITPAVNSGVIVLCDRHTDSTVAYQGYARGLNIERLHVLNNIATSGVVPDLTLVFDVETEIAAERVGKNKDRMESESIEFHKKVRYGYLELAKQSPDRIRVINANNDIESVFNDTVKVLNNVPGIGE